MSALPILTSNKPVIVNQLMTANLSSGALDVSGEKGYAVQAVWSGTPTGTIIVEASLNGSTFAQIASQALAGAAGNYFLNVPDVYYTTVQVRYAFTSGTGTLNVTVSTKRI